MTIDKRVGSEQEMSNQQVSRSRRSLLLGTVGLGAALPSAWTKPIVNAVILPTHAMTSPIFSFSVDKTQSGGANPAMVVGDVIEYSIVVTNTGTEPLTNVVATDTLPDGTIEILSGPVESLTADGVLEVNETWTYSTSYTATDADIMAGGNLTNSVSVQVDEVPAPETDDVDTPVEAVVCPAITIANVVTTTQGSGAVICSLNFEVTSASATPLTITGITNTALSAGATITYETFPVDVTNTTGTRVAWTGGIQTPECTDFSISNVVFTVTATCVGALDPITMDFSLADIAAMA